MAHQHTPDEHTPDGHTPHHDDDVDVDWAVLGPHLEAGAELQLPVLTQAATRLRDLQGERRVSRILDVGSGPGVMACVLAATFPDAEVVAVDGAPELLERTVARAERLGLTSRVRTHRAPMPEGLRDTVLPPADLVWTSKTVHHLGDQQAALDALVGLLRPGGVLAVVEDGLPMRFLPRDIGMGRPGLQARLDAVHEEWFERMRASLPGAVDVVEDWPRMLAAAGLVDVAARSFLLDVPPPAPDAARAFLHSTLLRYVEHLGEALQPGDQEVLAVLVDPDDERSVLRRADVFVRSAITMVTGRRPSVPAEAVTR